MARKTQIHAAELPRANARSGNKFGETKTLHEAPKRLTIDGKKPISRSLPETYILGVFGGAKRDRTADLFNAIEALSQLS